MPPFDVTEVTKKPARKATNEYTRSLLKWAGGKFTQLDDILPLLQGHERLIEPFVGGGSVFLNAGFKTVLANDNCHDLINTYQQLQERAYEVIGKAFQLFRLFNTPYAFLKIRDKFNAARYTPVERAAAFIYLNRHCFNGLTRYNQSGAFNVGYGKYLAPYFPLDEIEAFVDRCQGVRFSCGGYEDAIAQAGAGDVVFCDPPYEPLAGKDGFTRYSNMSAFTMKDQSMLVDCTLAAHQHGAKIIITNSGAQSIKALYAAAGFTVHDVKVKRSMSSTSGTKTKASDVIAVLG